MGGTKSYLRIPDGFFSRIPTPKEFEDVVAKRPFGNKLFRKSPRALATYLADNILSRILSNKLMALLKRRRNAMPQT